MFNKDPDIMIINIWCYDKSPISVLQKATFKTPGIIQCMRPANETVTPSLIGSAYTEWSLKPIQQHLSNLPSTLILAFEYRRDHNTTYNITPWGIPLSILWPLKCWNLLQKLGSHFEWSGFALMQKSAFFTQIWWLGRKKQSKKKQWFWSP